MEISSPPSILRWQIAIFSLQHVKLFQRRRAQRSPCPEITFYIGDCKHAKSVFSYGSNVYSSKTFLWTNKSLWPLILWSLIYNTHIPGFKNFLSNFLGHKQRKIVFLGEMSVLRKTVIL